MTDRGLHRALEPVAFLLGTWRGSGTGEYPTIDRFSYEEEAYFWHLGRPVLLYLQRTWAAETGDPMHSEMGYWRPQRDGSIEIVLAHGFGIVEIAEGSIDGTKIHVTSKELASTSSAKQVQELARTFSVDGDSLSYSVEMAYGPHAIRPHLRAELRRS